MGSGCIYIAVLYFIHAFVNGRDFKPILIVFPEDGGGARDKIAIKCSVWLLVYVSEIAGVALKGMKFVQCIVTDFLEM